MERKKYMVPQTDYGRVREKAKADNRTLSARMMIRAFSDDDQKQLLAMLFDVLRQPSIDAAILAAEAFNETHREYGMVFQVCVNALRQSLYNENPIKAFGVMQDIINLTIGKAGIRPDMDNAKPTTVTQNNFFANMTDEQRLKVAEVMQDMQTVDGNVIELEQHDDTDMFPLASSIGVKKAEKRTKRENKK